MFDFDAGKYAIYVWGAYGAAGAALLWMVADTCARARYWRRKAEQAEARRDAGREA